MITLPPLFATAGQPYVKDYYEQRCVMKNLLGVSDHVIFNVTHLASASALVFFQA